MDSLFMKEGRVKSTLLLNSFCLSIVFLAIYGLVYVIALPYLDRVMSGSLAAPICTVIESGICGLVGSIVCCAFFFLVKNKRVVLGAYIWLFSIYAIVVIGVINTIETAARTPFLYIAGFYIWAPLLVGSILSIGLYKGWFKKKIKEGQKI